MNGRIQEPFTTHPKERARKKQLEVLSHPQRAGEHPIPEVSTKPRLRWLSKANYSLIILLILILDGKFDRSTADPVEKRNAVLVDEAKRYVSGV